METEIYDFTAGWQESQMAHAGALLRSGQLVAFPTETVYGLGGSALDEAAARAIYTAKGRPSDNPLIVHISHREMLSQVAEQVPPVAYRLMDHFWPGPLTMILSKKPEIPDAITGGLRTVGVRMPDHAVALALIAAAGIPIAAPSANLSGKPSPTTAQHVYDDLQGRIPLILDGGACREGVESTVLDLSLGHCVILRPGAITYEMLLPFLPDLIAPTLQNPLPFAEVPKAPGMKYTHYAPKATVILYSGSRDAVCKRMIQDATAARKRGEKIGVIMTQYQFSAPADLVFDLSAADEARMLHRTAQHLFECFRACDDAGVNRILLQGVTEKELGRAVMNRMVKAAKEWICLE